MSRARPAPEEAASVLPAFGVTPAEVEGISDFGGGFANWSYRVRCGSGEEYVLTLCANKTPGEVEGLVAVLRAVADAGVATNELVETPRGGHVASWFGVPVILKALLPGGELADPRAEVVVRAGRELGLLGDVAPPAGVPDRHSYGLHLVDELTPEERAGGGAWFVEQAASLRERRPPEGREGLIHGDLFPDNMVVSPGGQVALIDFEEACRERLMLDVGMACVGLVDAFGPVGEALAGFVSGYLERQPGVAAELPHLGYYMEVGATMTALWRHRERIARGEEARAADPAAMIAIAEAARRDDGELARIVAAAAWGAATPTGEPPVNE